MSAIWLPVPVARPRALESILLGGMVAGTLDGLDAILFFGWLVGATPVRIFQYIAAGLVGPESYHGGGWTVALGLVIHFTVATVAATVFYLLSLKLPVLFQRPFVFGPIFGLIVYVFMYYLIVPLSAVPKSASRTFSGLQLLNELVAHVFFVGIPIAVAANCSARSRSVLPSR